MRLVERLDIDLPWSDTRREPQLPAILRVYSAGNLSEEFKDMLDDAGFFNYCGIAVGINECFSFPGGELTPCRSLRQALPMAKWLMAVEDSELKPTDPSELNVSIFTVIEGEVN